jgi:hypothetical protein
MDISQCRPGVVCRHHSGRVYTILGVANTKSLDFSKFPTIVYYRGANGEEWARLLKDFAPNFSVLFDGATLAD